MATLPLDHDKVADCRHLARGIAANVQQYIDGHTTVAVERTVLRLLGVDGTGEHGAPLANLLVETLHKAGVLGKGAAWWMGRCFRLGMDSPTTMALELPRLLAAGDRGVPPLSAEDEQALQDDVAALARDAVEELGRRREHRKALRRSLGIGPDPQKYIIVATGNIHEDAVQARAAAQAGAQIIAVIRSTAQSLLDYVPQGATTEGFGGTYATQENFRIMREALDDESRKLGRYIQLTNYSSGLCMPEIAYMAAHERLDMLLNDSMYGILFRDINMRRTFIDQYFSRRIVAHAGIIINTGEDNYLTTADAVDKGHTVLTSQFINEALAHLAGMKDSQLGLGHAHEIDPWLEDSWLLELAMAQLVRQVFPAHPIKFMPPTKHMTGDIFWSHVYDAMFNLATVATRQSIQLAGVMTEAMHTPLMMDRYAAIKSVNYIFNAARHLGEEIEFKRGGIIDQRARLVLDRAHAELQHVSRAGLMDAIGEGVFADTRRKLDGGKGHDGVVQRDAGYFNPFLSLLTPAAEPY
ncbi:MAG: D-lysine 5,6-aminomutase subunit alpha [Deltaproteobacteria bacterium]|nr:D-lysine 5,6-aminomutase subunit alpha [Deltaproteobacteria bacterium]